MKICPICKKEYSRPPAISREDGVTPICPICGVRQSLEAAGMDPKSGDFQEIVNKVEELEESAEETCAGRSHRIKPTRLSPYERTRAQVEATGNIWAMENFYATH